MSEVLAPQDISPTMLKQMFDDAFMDTSIDSDGDLRVEEDGLGCYVLPINQGDRIKLLTVWNSRSTVPASLVLDFANRVNDGVITVRVSVNKNLIFFDYYIPVEGGITRRAIVLATKHFLHVQKLAVLQFGGEEVLG